MGWRSIGTYGIAAGVGWGSVMWLRSEPKIHDSPSKPQLSSRVREANSVERAVRPNDDTKAAGALIERLKQQVREPQDSTYASKQEQLQQQVQQMREKQAAAIKAKILADIQTKQEPFARRMLVDQEWKEIVESEHGDRALLEFTSGKITAQQAMAQLRTLMPGSCQYADEDCNKRITNELMARDPAKALALFDAMEPKARYGAVTEVSRSLRDPQAVLSLFQAVPRDSSLGGTLQQRFEVWGPIIANSYRRYDDDLVTWVKQMPHGYDRDMALSALAQQIENMSPERAKELRSLKTIPAPPKKPATPAP